ncbi:MAG: hypothetical protein R3C59_26175 [Planctomycetaceae bacterium]
MIEPVFSPDRLTELANAAFRQAAEKVIREARQTNTEVVVWKDGKVCHLSADEAERELRQSTTDSPK